MIPEHLFSGALEAATSGICIASAGGRERRMLYVNRALERLLGWPREELVGKDPKFLAAQAGADLQELDAAIAEGRLHEMTVVARRRDGGTVDVHIRLMPTHEDQWIAVVDDVSDRAALARHLETTDEQLRRLVAELRAQRDRAQRYLDVAGACIAVIDPDESVALLNRAGHEVLGHEDGALLGENWFDAVFPAEDREHARAAFHRLLAGERDAEAAVDEREVVTRDGERRTIAWQHTVLRDDEGRPTAALSSGVDLTERRAAEQQIAYLAYHDPLTGLPNRALLQEHLELAMARARRSGTAVALLYLDLDDFKLVNDSLGHPAGDELLCQLAMRLGERRRGMDLLARQGGDEFLLLLSDLDRAEAERTARRVADGLQRALAQPFVIAGAEFHVGASIGLSLYPRDASDGDQLLRHADAAMYQAKNAGRGSVNTYAGGAHEPLERLSMTSRLRKALARGEFLIHWQPIVAPDTGALRKVEALIRWEDPFRGLVLPGDFIEFAEETGLIDRVGEWVLDAVSEQVRAWREDGYEVPSVTVNVSPRQLRRPDFAAVVRRHLDAGPPELFTVEITESAAMADPARTEPALQELADAGVRIAIDDFGAGYSSLTRLRRLPVSLLKIDRSFLQGVPGDAEATAIVSAIVDLAGALGMEAVAEGVETEAQREFLIAAGCPLAQGFLLGRPMPAEDLARLLTRAPTRH